jgi:uncharacterized DUF497 family protein
VSWAEPHERHDTKIGILYEVGEWDTRKEAQNVAEHGIDFTTASWIWHGFVSERPDSRRDYGEERFVAFGLAENRILAVVYTWRREFG